MSTDESPLDATGRLDRAVAWAVNAFEVARYGGLRTEAAPAPFEVVAHEPVFRLRHYFPETSRPGQPVLLIPPLMQVAEVFDISPETSAVSMLHDRGVDPWVVDFGDPKTEPGGSERTFSDHVLAVADAVERVRTATGQDVHLGGYSQGGVFSYLVAAYLSCKGIASVFVLGSPVGTLPVDELVPERLFWEATRLPTKVLGRTGLSQWAVAQGFTWSSPHRTLKADFDYLRALHDRESLLPREPQRKFLRRGAWIGWSGPAIAEMLEVLEGNRLMDGGVVIGDRTVGLSDITCPILIFVGEADYFAPPAIVRQIREAAPKANVFECSLPVGHFGLPVSSHAREKTWPGIAAWVRWNGDDGQLPDYIYPLPSDESDGASDTVGRSRAANVTYGLGTALQAGLSLPRATARSGQRLASTVLDLSSEAVEQLPRLVRLERMGPGTRVSYAAMLDDAARTNGDGVAFLYDDRAHTHAAAKARIDNVVRGLLSVGVRRGDQVGVLMDMRPSALISVAALNRIGAVAVMLRPGEDVGAEVRLGQVTKVISDPQRAEAALRLGVDLFVLGGGSGSRDLPAGAFDLERIDPSTVDLPAWYRANPGRGRDLAFVLFSGHGESTRADRISNARWATSGLAAAAAAALTRQDTVYSISPLHHPSGLLLTTAATTASGARLAMSRRFDPDSFWSEVRRYGVTVVPYTWTMLHSLVAADPQPEERNHPIRLFVGSGMPAGLWRRVEQRFGPAGVLELYASTRSDAILGNVSGRKVGAAGRPLPGTPKVRIVAYDATTAGPVTGDDGYAVECEPGEIGLLLVQAQRGRLSGNDVPLRGMFAPDDVWVSTGDLFRADRDGDLWFVESLSALITTEHGILSPRTVERALGALDAVGLVACYQGFDPATGNTLARAAVTTRDGHELSAASLDRALERLDPGIRPDEIHVVGAMPTTSWFRPSIADLHTHSTAADPTWRLDRRTGTYH